MGKATEQAFYADREPAGTNVLQTNIDLANPSPIGGTTPATGDFTVLKITTIKSGATQAAAGAAADELWKTLGHATLPDNVVLIGV